MTAALEVIGAENAAVTPAAGSGLGPDSPGTGRH